MALRGDIPPELRASDRGGMDYLVYNDFAVHLIEGKPMPITVEDAAAWMAVTPLSAESLRTKSTVDFPRF